MENNELYLIFKNIDEQHKKILDTVNDLKEACTKQEVKEKVIKLIQLLDEYVTEHFRDEEYLAKKIGFIKVEGLKDEHNYFRGIYYELCFHYKYKNNNHNKYYYLFSVYLVQSMIEWLDYHINTLDKELMDFVEAKLKD